MRDSKGRFIKGYKPIWSEESRKKVSDSMKGVNTWSKGRTLSDEHKSKCRKNASKYWLGKKRPELTGELHPNWKTIKAQPIRDALRDSFKYKTWKKVILKRDNYKCTLCESNKKLEVDHYPKRFVDIVIENNLLNIEDALSCENLWRLDIARTLCRECHKKTPTWGNRYKAIKTDMI